MQSLSFPNLLLAAWRLLLHIFQFPESYLTLFVSFMAVSHKSYNATKSREPLAFQRAIFQLGPVQFVYIQLTISFVEALMNKLLNGLQL